MATVKINRKKYEVPRFDFAQMDMLETAGYNMIDLLSNRKVFAAANAFTMLCTGFDRDDAANLVQQHVMGGGDLAELAGGFYRIAEESGFFKAWMKNPKEEKETPKSSEETEE